MEIDASKLVAPPGMLEYPAPYWFLVTFKVFGFLLHMVPMNLWYAGVPLAMLLRVARHEHARQLSARLMSQMPVIIAYGVNFGIVPLLFTQVAYHRVFYPATILMAWPWLSVILLLTVAYYGVYIYAGGLKGGSGSMLLWRQVAGWMAAVSFLAIGFLFANAFSLMTNGADWGRLWQRTSAAAAPTGLALNTADPTLWPRWWLMLSLAITTTAVYAVVDAAWRAGDHASEYRAWVSRFAARLYTFGALAVVASGSWYVFGTWSAEIRHAMFQPPWLGLTALTGVAPVAVWALVWCTRGRATRRNAMNMAMAQVGLLALNAVSRQVVQNFELSRFVDVTAHPVRTQWGPLVLFLGFFVVGLGVVAWMLSKARAAYNPRS